MTAEPGGIYLESKEATNWGGGIVRDVPKGNEEVPQCYR